jgi:integrase
LPSEPVDTTSPYKNVLRLALAAVRLPASRPAYTRDDGTVVPAVEGVRLHDYADLLVMPTSV